MDLPVHRRGSNFDWSAEIVILWAAVSVFDSRNTPSPPLPAKGRENVAPSTQGEGD